MRQYQELVESVLASGTYKSTRTGVDTIASFSEHYAVDLADGYPLLTTKRMDGYRWNSLLHELEWYLSGEEHIRTLREETSIWDAWADEEGHLDTAYGRFWRRFPIPDEPAQLPGESWPKDGHRWVTEEADGRRTFDQLRYVVDTLSDEPHSRRLVVSAWHPANAAVSTLPPCHYSFVFSVQGGRLNCHLTQRSADVALGVPFNIAAYALLTLLISKQTGFEPGLFAHTLIDAHVYCGTGDRGEWYETTLDTLQARLDAVESREEFRDLREWIETEAPPEDPDAERLDHVPGLLEQLSRTPRERPQLELGADSIDEFTAADVTLLEYDSYDGLRFAVAE